MVIEGGAPVKPRTFAKLDHGTMALTLSERGSFDIHQKTRNRASELTG
jgi:hypothetical protein